MSDDVSGFFDTVFSVYLFALSRVDVAIISRISFSQNVPLSYRILVSDFTPQSERTCLRHEGYETGGVDL
jgi:hypothetical protein